MFVTLIKTINLLHSIDLLGNVFTLSKLTEEQYLSKKDKYVVIRLLIVLNNKVLVIDSNKKISLLVFKEGLERNRPLELYKRVNEIDLYTGFTSIDLVDYERIELVRVSKHALESSVTTVDELKQFIDTKLVQKENIINRLSLGALNPYSI